MEKGNKKIIFGIVVAIVIGFLSGGIFPEISTGFSFLGEIFLNLLMMIVVPLVVLSIIVGITNLGDIRKIGPIGRRTITYYMVTTLVSVIIGLILVNIINPGKGIVTSKDYPREKYIIEKDKKTVRLVDRKLQSMHTTKSSVLLLIDQNILGDILTYNNKYIKVANWRSAGDKQIFDIDSLRSSGSGLKVYLPLIKKIESKKDGTILGTFKEVFLGNKEKKREGMIPRNIFNAMVNMEILPLIFFSILFGAALSVLGEKGKGAIEFFSTLNDAILKIVHWIMYFAPIGIFGIISARIGNAGGFSGFLPELVAIGKYSFTVLGGLFIHGGVVLVLILLLFARRKPWEFFSNMGAALLNAFSTASSSATLPITMENAEVNNKISKRVAGFVLPIGATINMDGTALYEAVAAMFIAQVYGIDLGFGEQVIIALTATLAAIGAAGIPEAGLVTMVIVLKAVGLPIEGIGIILSVDWLLDRFRTTVNVWGDSVGTAVIEMYEEKDQNYGNNNKKVVY